MSYTGNSLSKQSCSCVRCRCSGYMGPAVLTTLGVLLLIDQFSPRWRFGETWPILLIVMGVIIFLRRMGSTEGHIEPGQNARPGVIESDDAQGPHV